MQITNEKVVTLSYELTVTDTEGQKELIETVEQDDPMAFIQGMSGLPEAFEENIEGLSEGDTFEFSIPVEEGYGEFDPTAIVELPKEIFQVDGEFVEEMLEVGNYLPMTDDTGNQLNGKSYPLKMIWLKWILIILWLIKKCILKVQSLA